MPCFQNLITKQPVRQMSHNVYKQVNWHFLDIFISPKESGKVDDKGHGHELNKSGQVKQEEKKSAGSQNGE